MRGFNFRKPKNELRARLTAEEWVQEPEQVPVVEEYFAFV